MVKWISHVSSEHGFGVRVPTRPPSNCDGNNYRLFTKEDREAVIDLWKKINR